MSQDRWRWVAATGLLTPWLLALAGVDHPVARYLWSPICHQLPERTLTLAAPMVVCSRCAGLYAGAAAGLLLVLPAPLATPRAVWLAAGALGLEVLLQETTQQVHHVSRLLTGLALGAAVGALLRVRWPRPAEAPRHPAPAPHRDP